MPNQSSKTFAVDHLLGLVERSTHQIRPSDVVSQLLIRLNEDNVYPVQCLLSVRSENQSNFLIVENKTTNEQMECFPLEDIEFLESRQIQNNTSESDVLIMILNNWMPREGHPRKAYPEAHVFQPVSVSATSIADFINRMRANHHHHHEEDSPAFHAPIRSQPKLTNGNHKDQHFNQPSQEPILNGQLTDWNSKFPIKNYFGTGTQQQTRVSRLQTSASSVPGTKLNGSSVDLLESFPLRQLVYTPQPRIPSPQKIRTVPKTNSTKPVPYTPIPNQSNPRIEHSFREYPEEPRRTLPVKTSPIVANQNRKLPVQTNFANPEFHQNTMQAQQPRPIKTFKYPPPTGRNQIGLDVMPVAQRFPEPSVVRVAPTPVSYVDTPVSNYAPEPRYRLEKLSRSAENLEVRRRPETNTLIVPPQDYIRNSVNYQYRDPRDFQRESYESYMRNNRSSLVPMYPNYR